MIPKFDYFSYSVICYTSIVYYILSKLEKILLIGKRIGSALCCSISLEGKTGWVSQKKKKKSCKSAFYISFLGKVERQITEAGNNRSSRAVEALLEAIKLSQRHDQKLE